MSEETYPAEIHFCFSVRFLQCRLPTRSNLSFRYWMSVQSRKFVYFIFCFPIEFVSQEIISWLFTIYCIHICKPVSRIYTHNNYYEFFRWNTLSIHKMKWSFTRICSKRVISSYVITYNITTKFTMRVSFLIYTYRKYVLRIYSFYSILHLTFMIFQRLKFSFNLQSQSIYRCCMLVLFEIRWP